MKGTVPLVGAKLRARAHHRNQYAAGFQETEGMADMIAVAAPVKGRIHDDAVIDGRRGKRKEVRLPHRFKAVQHAQLMRSEEHTSELQSLMRTSYAVFCLNKKTNTPKTRNTCTRYDTTARRKTTRSQSKNI